MSWAKLDDRFWTNRKVRRAWRASKASIGLHVMAITYCAQNETDGHVDTDLVEMLLPAPRDRDRTVAALVDAGLWDRADDGYVIHDYLEFNDSRVAAEARRRKDSERKRRANPDGVQTESARNPDGVDAESDGIPSDPSRAPAFSPTRPDPTRPSTTQVEESRQDVERLCRLLAELILANDPKAKVAPDSKGWRDAARLLIDSDGRTVEEAERVIRFSQTDMFWRTNVLSMPTVRKQFTPLLLKMQQQPNGRNGISASDQAAAWIRGAA